MYQPRTYHELAHSTALHCARLTPPAFTRLSLEEANQWLMQNPQLNYARPLPTSTYQLNLPTIHSLWHDNGIKGATELFNKILLLDNQTHLVSTLLPTEQPLHLIGFKNNWRSKQRDVLRYIAPGEWYLGTSHRNPSERFITRQTLQDPLLSRSLLNLSIDHIRHYIGVCDTSQRAGVVAVDVPRHYASEQAAGHINPKDHPALLWRLRFPSHITPAQQRAYINNIRTWTMLLHKIVRFAESSSGSDVVHYATWEQIEHLGQQILATLQQRGRTPIAPIEAQQVSLVEASFHLPLNLGLNIPLNETSITELYGQEAWFTVQRLVREGRRIWRANRIPDIYGLGAHHYVQYSEQHRMVQLELAPQWLMPFKQDLVFKPWGVQGVLLHCLQRIAPHWDTQDWHTSNQLADILSYLKPTLLLALGVPSPQLAPPELVLKFDELISTIRTHHPSYQALLQQLQPRFEQIEQILKNAHLSKGAYLPVAYLLHLAYPPQAVSELALEPMGQMLHVDLLKPIEHK
ncbi:MAG: hypothetical protein WAQ53_18455 [Thiofilum sp.]|uniref:hypothetical protein n=1 Tax=Thiofilum sp. TaxID=2212733 RepID=UPI0025DD56D1|nr:hypothetical protein [Thiofilum sp.]MBK8451955.1 hypothetical protein [Thiofilum sp.]